MSWMTQPGNILSNLRNYLFKNRRSSASLTPDAKPQYHGSLRYSSKSKARKARNAYISNAKHKFVDDEIIHIYPLKFDDINEIDVRKLLDPACYRNLDTPPGLKNLDLAPSFLHESERKNYAEVILNVGVRRDGEHIFYTSPSHMDALKARLPGEARYLPRAARSSAAVSRIKPSAGIHFERHQASDLSGMEELADFAIIRF